MIAINKPNSNNQYSPSTSEHYWRDIFQQTPFTVVASWGRAVAFFLGSFTLLNIIGDLRYPGFDANIWWIDFRFVDDWISKTILLLAAIFMLAFAFKPTLSKWRQIATLTLTIILYLVCIINVIVFYILAIKGTIDVGVWIPFSLFVSMSLEVVAIATIVKRPPEGFKREWLTTLIVLAFCTTAFPLAQMFCFGKTDYTRQADVIVVFGARVYKSGQISDALADRVRTGCNLYKDGFAKKIILSGGPGDGDVHETQAMKKAALQWGVPLEAIIIDAAGLSTHETVKNTTLIFRQKQFTKVLAVSHFYHLPRIKMSYQRHDYDVYTVGAKESYTLTAMPKYMIREIAAFWAYYILGY